MKTQPSQPPRYPRTQSHSTLYQVWVDGRPVEVLHTAVADFAAFDCHGPVEITVEVKVPESLTTAIVRPLGRGITPVLEGRKIRFGTARPQNLCLEIPGQIELFIYANPPEKDRPSPDDPKVHFFRAGQIYEVGEMALKSGETLYIEAGAVVKGCVRAMEASDLRICGRGVLDGSFYRHDQGERVQSIQLERCHQVTVEDIIMIEPSSWMLVLGLCDGVHVRNLKQIGEVMSSDGIDICGSKGVVIEGCCLRNNDDNVVIKAIGRWQADVENVRVRDCVFWNAQAGNVMEIGHELRTGRVHDIVFEDIDVLCVHGFGAVFSIHNADRATVENIRWENIRVEHYFDKLIDFRVFVSRWSGDAERGRIRRVHLKNIRVVNSIYNPGYSLSAISGYAPSAPVEKVTIEDFHLGGKTVTSPDQLDLHTRNVTGLEFR